MTQFAAKPVNTKIPVQLNENEFEEFILPYLSMPKRGPECKIGYWKVFNYILKLLYTGMQWKELPIEKDANGDPEIHHTVIFKQYGKWSDDGSLLKAFEASVQHLSDEKMLNLSVLHGDGTNTVAKKGGDGIGYSGHKHQRGEKVLAIVDNHGYVLAPYTIAPANRNDCILLPDSLDNLSHIARKIGFSIKGAVLNLDGVFDSKKNRKHIFNRCMIPNIPENNRNRKKAKRGRKRLFDEAIHALRLTVERTFAWEDKFKRLLLRFERIQSRHFTFKLLAYTMINIRQFCQP
ncbi:MAG: transposase [Desulfobacteraceae bacterium]|nr:transposase [Desulfobacteraceae bacterium]